MFTIEKAYSPTGEIATNYGTLPNVTASKFNFVKEQVGKTLRSVYYNRSLKSREGGEAFQVTAKSTSSYNFPDAIKKKLKSHPIMEGVSKEIVLSESTYLLATDEDTKQTYDLPLTCTIRFDWVDNTAVTSDMLHEALQRVLASMYVQNGETVTCTLDDLMSGFEDLAGKDVSA